MNEREREIDRAIRRARRREFFRQLGEAKMILIIGVIMLGFIIVGVIFSSSQAKLQATVMGRTLNEATARSNSQGQAVRLEVVQLDDGSVVEINVPSDHPLPPGTSMKVEVYEKSLGPLHQVSYRFVSFADATGQS